MKKYLVLIYITFSVLSFAQFKDNVFENGSTRSSQDVDLGDPARANATEMMAPQQEGNTNSSFGVPTGGEHEENPGNPGDPIVPIDGYIPALLLAALALIVYYQTKNRKIKI